jgi:hypothetical protein
MGVWGFIAQSRLNFPQRRNSRIIRVFTLTRRQSCLLTFVPQGVQVPHIDSWYAPNMYPDVYRRIYIDWFQHTNCYCCTYVYMIYIYLSLSVPFYLYVSSGRFRSIQPQEPGEESTCEAGALSGEVFFIKFGDILCGY